MQLGVLRPKFGGIFCRRQAGAAVFARSIFLTVCDGDLNGMRRARQRQSCAEAAMQCAFSHVGKIPCGLKTFLPLGWMYSRHIHKAALITTGIQARNNFIGNCERAGRRVRSAAQKQRGETRPRPVQQRRKISLARFSSSLICVTSAWAEANFASGRIKAIKCTSIVSP